MERIILLILKRIYIAPIWFYKICKYGDNNNYNEKQRYLLIRNIVKKVNKSGNINIICYGKDNLPSESGYVMFPNHQGLFDALGIIDSHSKPFTFVAKIEVNRNFFLRRIVKLFRAQVMDRNDLRQSMKVIKQMSKEVEQERNYLIFPEGTRSKNKNELLDFKAGSFKSAVNAKCPIVPVAIIDSYKVFDSHSIKKADVIISYLEPLRYEDYMNLKTNEIAKLVKERINNYIVTYEMQFKNKC